MLTVPVAGWILQARNGSSSSLAKISGQSIFLVRIAGASCEIERPSGISSEQASPPGQENLCPVFSESAKCFCRTFPNSKRRCDSLPAQRTLYFVPLTSGIQDVCFCAAPAGMAHHAHRTAKSLQKRCILYIRNSSAAKLHFPVLVGGAQVRAIVVL